MIPKPVFADQLQPVFTYPTTSVTDVKPRCQGPSKMGDEHCGRLLAELVTRPWRIKCGRCGMLNQGSLGT